MDPLSLLFANLAAALAPVTVDMVKSAATGLSRKWFGLSIDDQIKVDQSVVEKMKALAALDAPSGTPSQWVIDLRASFRYIAAGSMIIVGAFALAVGTRINNDTITSLGAQLVSMPFSFIFGEKLPIILRGTPH